MNFDPEAVASWHGYSKTMPKRRFRRRVGVCCPYLTLVPEDAPQRNHNLREVFNGLRWIVRTGSAWRYMPHDLPTQGKPSTSRRGGGSLLAYSRRWSTICVYSCGFRRTERPIL
jgi:hypothetical protein